MKKVIAVALLIMAAGTAFASGSVFQADDWTAKRKVRKLDRYAFFACKSLTDVVLQEGVTELGEWSFCGITTKLRIVMPSTVKEFPGGVTENMAVWVVYKDGPAEAYAKGMNYKLEYR